MISREKLLELLPHAFGESDLPLPGREVGKVREWYPFSDGKRLIVTTDRLSAFDRILSTVPYKGQVLNQLSAWWFDQTRHLISNHLISVPDPNAAIVTEVEPLLVEVIVRGYISGVTTTALWYRYNLGEREIYGYRFPEGLRKNEQLPEPIITPTTKGGPSGHDERLTCAEVVSKGILDADTWEQVQGAALAIFKRGQELAQNAGLILVDTKYEFGRAPDPTGRGGRILLIDEVHTPDSSRFWKADSYESRFAAGQEPENFDKEFVRIAYAEGRGDPPGRPYLGDGEPPVMPAELWAAASERYVTIYEMLTGQEFVPGAYPVNERLVENLKTQGIF
jgi:phosphoribosylaminoimidazole-succinocarboxamide synthase